MYWKIEIVEKIVTEFCKKKKLKLVPLVVEQTPPAGIFQPKKIIKFQ